MSSRQWYSSIVHHGNASGRTINFPTVNLDAHVLAGKKEGIYAALVKFDNQIWRGVMFLGPRLVKKETNAILEIYLLHFKKTIYGEVVQFTPLEYIRPVKNFTSMEELKKMIEDDVVKAQEIFSRLKV